MSVATTKAKTAAFRKSPLTAKLEKIHSTDIKNNVYRCGGTASFVPLSKKRGVKLFPDKGSRDRCWTFQRILHQYGLAPKVFDRFEVDFQGSKRYCYTTERAVIRQEIDTEKVDFTNGKLVDALEALGLHWSDRHNNNFGILGKRTVVIDCDPVYFYPLTLDSPLRHATANPNNWAYLLK